MNLTITPLTIPSYLIFANGDRSPIHGEINLGNLTALVAHVTEPLLSVRDLVDNNYKVIFEQSGGLVTNSNTKEVIELQRFNNQWMIATADMLALRQDGKPTNFSSTNTFSLKTNPHAAVTSTSLPAEQSTQQRTAGISPVKAFETTSIADPIELTLDDLDGQDIRPRTTHRNVRATVIDLHEKMGHQPCAIMCQAISGFDPPWKNTGVTCAQVKRVMARHHCVTCFLAKRNKLPKGQSAGDRKSTLQPGDILSTDPVGKINPVSVNGNQYFFLFKDVATGFLHAIPSKTKTGFLQALKQVHSFYTTHGHKPKILRSDQGTEEQATDVTQWLSTPAIAMTREHSAPYAQYQNSVERDVQTVCKGVSAMLHGQMWLRADQWELALGHFISCRNASPNVHDKRRSPLQRVTNTSVNLTRSFLFTFGDIVAVNLPDVDRHWKFDVKNDIGIYVGQPLGSVHSCYIYWPYSHTISERTSVSKLPITDLQMLKWLGIRETMRQGSLPFSVIRDAVHDFSSNAEPQLGMNIDDIVENEAEPTFSFKVPLYDIDENEYVPDIASVEIPSRKRKASKIHKPSLVSRHWTRSHANDVPSEEDPYANFMTRMATVSNLDSNIYQAYSSTTRSDDTPTVRTAQKRGDWDKWTECIIKEVQMLIDRGTLEKVDATSLLKGSKVIHSTMQLKIKRLASGEIDKYKARCCARGDQLAGEIKETYSPTISALAYAVVHQLAVIDNMEMCTIDTVGAYLYQDYPDDALPIYMKFESAVANACGLDPNQLYRIRKYLYGLPDAGRAYYQAYSQHLISHDYKQTISDPCLFVKFDGVNRTYVWIHVDDTFVATTNIREKETIQTILREVFEITVSDNVDQYLGVSMTTLPDGSVKLTQPKQLIPLFEKYQPELMRKATTPMYATADEYSDQTPIDSKTYRTLLGSLIYILKSRPDIATALSFASTHAVNPTVGAYQELLSCVSYLYHTQDQGLILMRGDSTTPLTLRCYVDASYLVHPDSKSHTGYCLSFGDIGTFYSKSSKQSLVTTSSTHAEMRALYQLSQEIVYVVALCDELHRPISLPAIVMEDNQPVIDLSGPHSGRTKKCKHFLMLINYIRERVDEGLFELRKVPSHLNSSDLLTKRLGGQDYRHKAQSILGVLPGETRILPVNPKQRHPNVEPHST